MLETYFKYPRVIERFRRGALGDEIDAIAADLLRVGYTHGSAKLYLSHIARFSAYATASGCSKAKPIKHEVVDRYLLTMPTVAIRWTAQVAIGHAARRFPIRFSTKPVPADPHGALLADYLQHLLVIRGLHSKTCEGRILTARRMLAWRGKRMARATLRAIAPKHVLVMTHELLSACRSDYAKKSTSAHMRSFLRFLHWANLNAADLSPFVPRTPRWRHAHLPPRLTWEEVQSAIHAIGTTTPTDIRDLAMLLLLATTGIRNRELRQLELKDIRWRTGVIVLRRTKSHRDRVVPLLHDTGAALADYVLHARPRSDDRRVFLSHVTPVRPFDSSGTISRIILKRLRRAGISIQRGGAHLIRHSLATRMVEQRRPIKEVADLLGHRNIDTTSLYIKVAVSQLADIGLPFPGGAP